MIFGANRGQLDDAQKVARAHWQQATEHWGDTVQKQHQHDLVEPLDDQVSELLRNVDQLTSIIAGLRAEIDYQQNS
jgi:hypothetical protein